MRYLLCLLVACALPALAQSRKLLVISVDGLDHRYLTGRDALKLRIPNLRKLLSEGSLVNGLIGVVPTNTWPSHTTLVTGRRSQEHGILDNNIRTAKGVERYWYMSYLKAPTLWQAASKAGRKTAAITWPVTVGDGIDYNLPEYFQGRNGGAMDLKSIEEKATPGLVAAITKEFPSFATPWMDDRARALGTIYMLRKFSPDLTLLHFVDHDSIAHDEGPFTRAAIASLEYTDELIGQILRDLPANTVVAVVSDHGFEAVSRELNLIPYLRSKNLSEMDVQVHGGFLSTSKDEVAAALLREASQTGSCVGREIPRAEIDRFLPGSPAANRLFEPAPGCYFMTGKPDAAVVTPVSPATGRHGHWPTRYRAALLLWGPGVKRGQRPEMDMRDVAREFASILGIAWPVK